MERNTDSETLADIWGDFIDWNERMNGPDSEFIMRQLICAVRERILDACLGDGVDSIHLLKSGFRVTSNEIDKAFASKAIENAGQHGVVLDITNHNWLEFDEHFPKNSFGGIICMGNSLTYLFKREEQLKALKNFYRSLKPGGKLVIDERNYQYFLDNREDILKGNFRYSGKVIYHGQKVHSKPIAINDNLVIMEYEHTGNGKRGRLPMSPFKKNELIGLLSESGFNKVSQYSDYQPGYNAEADFHQYVAVK